MEAKDKINKKNSNSISFEMEFKEKYISINIELVDQEIKDISGCNESFDHLRVLSMCVRSTNACNYILFYKYHKRASLPHGFPCGRRIFWLKVLMLDNDNIYRDCLCEILYPHP